MQIGLISDTHNEHQRIQKALEHFRTLDITTILHAGDITSVATLELFADFDVWLATGNMDRDPRLRQTATRLFGRGRFADVQRITLDAVTIALTHGDNYTTLNSLIRSKNYTYIIHGHTHMPRDEVVNSTRILNPGALSHPRGPHPVSYGTLELTTGEFIRIKL